MEDLGHDILVIRTELQPKINPVQTLGNGTVYADRIKPVFDFKTMELEQDKNQRRDDAIPPGLYPFKKHISPKFGPCIWIKEIPRSVVILG